MGYVACNKKGESLEEQLDSKYMIDVAGKRILAKAFFKPAYDPDAIKVKL